MKILAFLNLLDSDGNLSITNIAVILAVGKIAHSTQVSGADIGMLLTTLFNYCHKRTINNDAEH